MDARVTDLPSGALEAAGELLRRTLVWDNHACMPLRPGDEGFLPQLERLRASGVNVVSLNVGFGPQDLDAHVRMLATFRRWVAAHPDETQRLVRAVARALAFISTHSASAIMAALPKNFVGENEALYRQALSATIPAFSRDGRMPDGAPQTVLGVLSAVDPSIEPRHVDLARTYTNGFADEANAAPAH